MDVPKTSLSAGAILRTILMEDPEVSVRAKKIIPVIAMKAELPYLVYRRISLEPNLQKFGQPGADSVQIEITCCAATYTESVELAEAVRHALDMIRCPGMRSCYLSDSQEDWQADAFIQSLIFNVKI